MRADDDIALQILPGRNRTDECPPGRQNAPDLGKLIDLEMMMMPGGRERSESEFRALFASAGFELTRVVPTRSPLSVIEARVA